MRQYFRKFGIYYYQLIDSEGALELHPSLGIADIIVDLTSSGTTLKDNRLREIEGGTVLESAACLIGHAPSLATLAGRGRDRSAGPLARRDRRRPRRRGLAAPGSGRQPGRRLVRRRPRWSASHLRDQGASHIARGEVWDDRGSPGWRVTALLSARKLTACRRALFRLGASRVVGLPPRIVFDRDGPSTFDTLNQQLTTNGAELSEDLAMSEQVTLPMVHAFLVCGQIIQDTVTGQYSAINLQIGFALPKFPALVHVAIYGQMSEVRGEYYPEFRLWGPDGEVLWDTRVPKPMTSPDDDPLRQHRFTLRDVLLPFPRPGRYDLLLLARGTEIARYPLLIEHHETQIN